MKNRYVRDIANPSDKDTWFPLARHKDWYLGSSWASGVVTIQEQPYPNGRNEESSAEAIAAYESVALLGQVGMMAFDTTGRPLGESEKDPLTKEVKERR
jgi:endoglucanase Acf2